MSDEEPTPKPDGKLDPVKLAAFVGVLAVMVGLFGHRLGSLLAFAIVLVFLVGKSWLQRLGCLGVMIGTGLLTFTFFAGDPHGAADWWLARDLAVDAKGVIHRGGWRYDLVTDEELGHVSWTLVPGPADLRTCTRITDRGMETLARYRFKTLRLPPQITDAGLLHLHTSEGLHELDLRGCDKVTDAGVQRLREALPSCKVIR